MYKNFDTLNSDIRSLNGSTKTRETLTRMINAVSNAAQAINDLPDQWARAYAGVQTVEYDQDGHVTDVTTSDAISTVDATIARASGSFSSSRELYNSLNSDIGPVTTIHVDDQSVADVLGNAMVDIRQYMLDALPMNPVDGQTVDIPLISLTTNAKHNTMHKYTIITRYKFSASDHRWLLDFSRDADHSRIQSEVVSSVSAEFLFTASSCSVAGHTMNSYAQGFQATRSLEQTSTEPSSGWAKSAQSIRYSCGSYICQATFCFEGNGSNPEGKLLSTGMSESLALGTIVCDVPSIITQDGTFTVAPANLHMIFNPYYIGVQSCAYYYGEYASGAPNNIGSGQILAHDVDVMLGDILKVPDLDQIQEHIDSLID